MNIESLLLGFIIGFSLASAIWWPVIINYRDFADQALKGWRETLDSSVKFTAYIKKVMGELEKLK